MPSRILVDSSFLYSLIDLADKNRPKALTFLKDNRDQRLIPDIVLPEVAHVVRHRIGQRAVLVFLDALVESDAWLEPILKEDLKRARTIMSTYDTADFDLADCCIMALAERLAITQVCTFDRRDFSIFRPKHCDYLELLP